MNRKFEYIKGPASTNTPWFRPSGDLLNNWKKDFFKLKNVEKYNFWIAGGAIENWTTWDTDITVIGKIDDLKELEHIMVEATKIGFKHRQLIDINWVDYMYDTAYLQHIKNLGEAFRKKDFMAMEPVERELISICSFVIKNGDRREIGKDLEKIANSLWKRKVRTPSPKQIERINSGILYQKEPVLITETLDFRDIIT